jgi:uncharacterized protein
VSYVRLKHTLSKIALDAIEHPGRARAVTALAAYARMSVGETSARLADIAGPMGMSTEGVRRLLLGTGLFAPADGGRAIALAPAYRPFAPYFSRQVGRLGDTLHLLEAPRPAGVPPHIWRAAALFNAGLFFECHEYLEDLWRAAGEPERTFLHGLVQAAAGCYHLEKGNLHGARTLLGKAIAKLRPYAPMTLGLDVAALLVGLEGAVAAADATRPGRAWGRSDLPVMRLVEASGRAPVTPDGPAQRSLRAPRPAARRRARRTP